MIKKDPNITWIFNRHRNTNHMYDTDEYGVGIPYEFHLKLTALTGKKFRHLIPDEAWSDVKYALFGHDLIEDTRTSYNDVKTQFNKRVAEIIYAVTNEKGRNRKERANNTYYVGIVLTEYATFVKLCDRIANVKYSTFDSESGMYKLYKKENTDFINSLGLTVNNKLDEDHVYYELVLHLTNLFN